jgi:hypothetical protein
MSALPQTHSDRNANFRLAAGARIANGLQGRRLQEIARDGAGAATFMRNGA